MLAVLGLVAGLVLARGPQRSATLEMREAATAVAQAMRVARTRAIVTNRRVVVTLDPRTATLRIGTETPRRLPAGIAMAVVSTADVPGIAFLPDGSASGGRVELEVGGRRTQVGIDWLTGRVSVADGP